jgi:hypothetical protein
MVVMLFPVTCDTGVEHERNAAPSTCTVHAPHNPAPHPNLVPVSCSVSRNTHNSGVSGDTVTLRSLPFTRRVKSGMGAPIVSAKATHGSGKDAKVKMLAGVEFRCAAM